MQHPTDPIPVGVLGATGTVGQRFVTLLNLSSMVRHPRSWRFCKVGGEEVRGSGEMETKYPDTVGREGHRGEDL
jgi:aspartate-semialdehyde dehydrogenase